MSGALWTSKQLLTALQDTAQLEIHSMLPKVLELSCHMNRLVQSEGITVKPDDKNSFTSMPICPNIVKNSYVLIS